MSTPTMPNIELLERHFARIGAAFRADAPERRPWFRRAAVPWFSLDVDERAPGEPFVLRADPDHLDRLDLQVVNADVAQRHLLLHVAIRHHNHQIEKHKYLCGHDERHWFVAETPRTNVTTIREAMEALRPPEVARAVHRQAIKPKRRYRRRNRAFVRQGEWFFLPRPRLRLEDAVIHRHEPLRRSGGKPHLVEEIVRTGGQPVYWNARFPDGLTEAQYRRRLLMTPALRKLRWQVMRRNPRVFARGTVRHPDHATLRLRAWHEVAMAVEGQTGTVAFLD
ncbi:MAG: hypothetical protein AAF809_00110 [Bacteroidota bacterium]